MGKRTVFYWRGGVASFDRPLYKTTIVYEVLSDKPIPLGKLKLATEGQYLGQLKSGRQVRISDVEMCQALIDAGSEPSFFFGRGEK